MKRYKEKISSCCKAKIKKLDQYNGLIQYEICYKCGKPQDYGKIK